MLTFAKCVLVQTAAHCNVGQLLGERGRVLDRVWVLKGQ